MEKLFFGCLRTSNLNGRNPLLQKTLKCSLDSLELKFSFKMSLTSQEDQIQSRNMSAMSKPSQTKMYSCEFKNTLLKPNFLLVLQ